MSAGLTAEDVRRIVREENLRLLRVLLTADRERELGYHAADPALVALDSGDRGEDHLRQTMIDYREGR